MSNNCKWRINANCNSPVSVYAKVIEPGLARIIMFSMQGDILVDADNDLSSIIDIKFASTNNFTNGETNVAISNLILAGANGVGIECQSNSSFEAANNLVKIEITNFSSINSIIS